MIGIDRQNQAMGERDVRQANDEGSGFGVQLLARKPFACGLATPPESDDHFVTPPLAAGRRCCDAANGRDRFSSILRPPRRPCRESALRCGWAVMKNRSRAALSSTAGCRIGCTLMPRANSACESCRQCERIAQNHRHHGRILARAGVQAVLFRPASRNSLLFALKPRHALRLVFQQPERGQRRGGVGGEMSTAKTKPGAVYLRYSTSALLPAM